MLKSSTIKEHWSYYPAQEVFLFLFRGTPGIPKISCNEGLFCKAYEGGLMIFNKAGFAVVGSMATPKRAW